jgi:DNA-binding response OmpR family regulator
MSAPGRRSVILSIGHDARVLETQSAVLESAGWNVVSTMDDVEAIALAASRNADLALLADSIDPSERVFLGQTLKRMDSSLLIVMIDSDRGAGLPRDSADVFIESLSDPQILINEIRRLLNSRSRQQVAS